MTKRITWSAPAMAPTPTNATKLSKAKQANGSTSGSNTSRFMTMSPLPPMPIYSDRDWTDNAVEASLIYASPAAVMREAEEEWGRP